MALRSSVYIERNNTHVSTVAPLVTDDITKGAYVGAQWLDTVTNVLYKCTNTATGAAVWSAIGGSAGVHTQSISVSHLNWTAAALSAPYTLFALPAGAKILDIDIVQQSTDAHFAGPSVTAAHLEVGITGTLSKYTASTDVFTAGQNLTVGGVVGYESLSAPTNIIATLTLIGANLSVLTAGVATIKVSYQLV